MLDVCSSPAINVQMKSSLIFMVNLCYCCLLPFEWAIFLIVRKIRGEEIASFYINHNSYWIIKKCIMVQMKCLNSTFDIMYNSKEWRRMGAKKISINVIYANVCNSAKQLFKKEILLPDHLYYNNTISFLYKLL